MNAWWYCQDCPGVYTTYVKAMKHLDDKGHRLTKKKDAVTVEVEPSWARRREAIYGDRVPGK